QLLLDLACDNKFPAGLYNDLAANIFNNPDLSVRTRAGNCVKRHGAEIKLSPAAIADLKGDPASGKVTLQSVCANCHKVAGTGSSLGPDLTEISKKFDYPELLDAIINPGSGIVFGYEAWSVQTKNGDSFYGFLAADGPNVIIKDLGGKQHVIPEASIVNKKKQNGSVMPDPIALGLNEQQLSDLMSYLSTLK
ncbi:MAG TPA: c-type cytochrome, partial [Saprospiraceae bacterium]|nr:c-type cytochrome [Saprospiraceae bacterium]